MLAFYYSLSSANRSSHSVEPLIRADLIEFEKKVTTAREAGIEAPGEAGVLVTSKCGFSQPQGPGEN